MTQTRREPVRTRKNLCKELEGTTAWYLQGRVRHLKTDGAIHWSTHNQLTVTKRRLCLLTFISPTPDQDIFCVCTYVGFRKRLTAMPIESIDVLAVASTKLTAPAVWAHCWRANSWRAAFVIDSEVYVAKHIESARLVDCPRRSRPCENSLPLLWMSKRSVTGFWLGWSLGGQPNRLDKQMIPASISLRLGANADIPTFTTNWLDSSGREWEAHLFFQFIQL